MCKSVNRDNPVCGVRVRRGQRLRIKRAMLVSGATSLRSAADSARVLIQGMLKVRPENLKSARPFAILEKDERKESNRYNNEPPRSFSKPS
jgi:hypothetical protein